VPSLDYEVRCGTFRVKEDPAASGGREISLYVVVLPPAELPAAPNPILVLQGGPGQAATELAEFYGGQSWELSRRTREIVLVDQRGTGRSNPLRCDFGGQGDDPQSWLGEMLPPARVRQCRDSLSRKADLRLYSTPVAMQDLDQLREALGYERVNLYGTSYGTRAAMVYARAFPDRVRTITLKGVAPPSMVLPVTFAEDTQRSMELLFDDCAKDARCAAAFPSLRADVDTVMARLARGALPAVLRDSAGARADTVRLSRDVVTSVMRGALQSPPSAAQLPSIFTQAARGNTEPLARLALQYRRGAAQGLYYGMLLSVTCTEDVPFIDRTAAARQAAGTYLGSYWVDQLVGACAHWPAGKLPADYRTFEPLPIPTLLISGGTDPATPPTRVAEVQKLFPDSRHLIVRNGSHSFAGMRGCVDEQINELIERGSVRTIDVRCGEEIARPPFVGATSAQ
jgi:pimeloyl-ACP methyl ester carboxylesterase